MGVFERFPLVFFPFPPCRVRSLEDRPHWERFFSKIFRGDGAAVGGRALWGSLSLWQVPAENGATGFNWAGISARYVCV